MRSRKSVGDNSQATPTPLSTTALRTALGVRKQTLLALLHRLAVEGFLCRTGREGWTIRPPAVPGPEHRGGNSDRASAAGAARPPAR